MKSNQNRSEEGTALPCGKAGRAVLFFLSQEKQGNGFVKVSQILRETKGNCKNHVKNIQNLNAVFSKNR